MKNSYDADASYVIVRFEPPLREGLGRIIVTDDGHGMTVADIQEKWMEPATSSKVGGRKSPKNQRVMLGSKGIGRFAAAKLGRRMGLTSVSERGGTRTEVLISEIDWSIFSGDAYLSDISIDFLDQETDAPLGTSIEIAELIESWPEAKIAQLHQELRRLISPLHWQSKDSGFRIFLDLSDCTTETCGFDGRRLVEQPGDVSDDDIKAGLPADYEVHPFPLINTCDYEVDGWFDNAGKFHGSMEIKRAGQASKAVDLVVPLNDEEELPCGRVAIRLFIFDREAEVIRSTMKRAGMGELTAASARKILDNVAGVAIYRDGFRVRPYGDLQSDWLMLDARRVQDPSLRIGHNQVAGFVSVEPQANSLLVEKSSREGFEENAAFIRLKRLVRELFSRVVEPRRQQFREDAGLSRARGTTFEEVRSLSRLKRISDLLVHFPLSEREHARQVIDREASALSGKIEQLEDRQRILEAKSSLGAIVGEILHEGAPSANFVANVANRLMRQWKLIDEQGPQADQFRADMPQRLELLATTGARLRELFATLRPLAGGKRGAPRAFNAFKSANDAAGIFEVHSIPIKVVLPSREIELIGYPEDLATALVNLYSNSVYWLEQSRVQNPKIEVRITQMGGDASIIVEDNGPGIPAEFAERIFDIRFTLKDGGTGLGLNIAQEALGRSGAKLFFHQEYEEGARFEIRFPRYLEPQG